MSNEEAIELWEIGHFGDKGKKYGATVKIIFVGHFKFFQKSKAHENNNSKTFVHIPRSGQNLKLLLQFNNLYGIFLIFMGKNYNIALYGISLNYILL